MIKTVDALKTLYVALGGDASDVANISLIPDMIIAIAPVIAAAIAPELPAVTSTENGKVLKVVDGKWAVGTDATE